MNLDLERDLVLELQAPLSVEAVWRAWTTPELLVQWFTPSPWKTLEAEVELFPGGAFRTVMQGPDTPPIDSTGCVLVAEACSRFTFTSALLPGFRPRANVEDPFLFTGILTFEPAEGGMVYRAVARHADAEGKAAHEAMGFHAGWTAAFNQLVELMKTEDIER